MTPPSHATTADAMLPGPTDPASLRDTMSADDELDGARLLEHEYDGIREYDNPLPSWWSLVFGACIAFAFAYFAYYNIAGWGRTPEERYQTALATWQASYKAPSGAGMTEEMIAEGMQSSDMISRGAEVFAARCTGCHAADGSGQIGPNLTDLFQIHGATKLDMYKTIFSGAPGTAMIAWAEVIKPAELSAVTAYVATLRGKNLPGKEPQGNPVPAASR